MLFYQLLFAAAISVALYLSLNYYSAGLENIPGPFLARFSNLWRLIETWKGHYERTIQILHQRHGNIVRIGPNVVSLTDPDAIEGIYGVKADLPKARPVPPSAGCPIT